MMPAAYPKTFGSTLEPGPVEGRGREEERGVEPADGRTEAARLGAARFPVATSPLCQVLPWRRDIGDGACSGRCDPRATPADTPRSRQVAVPEIRSDLRLCVLTWRPREPLRADAGIRLQCLGGATYGYHNI